MNEYSIAYMDTKEQHGSFDVLKTSHDGIQRSFLHVGDRQLFSQLHEEDPSSIVPLDMLQFIMYYKCSQSRHVQHIEE